MVFPYLEQLMLSSRFPRFLCCLLLMVFTVSLQAQMQTRYPNRSIRWIVPFPAGGGGDMISRMVATKLAEALGTPVIVENVSGAQGNIGAGRAATAAADGYTLLFATYGTHAVNPSIYASLPFKEEDFTPVIWMANVPQVMSVHPAVPARTVKEFVALAKAKPAELNYASSSTINHVAAELFNTMADIKVTHIPYKGGAPGTLALLAGEVSMSFLDPTGALPHSKAGKLRILAVTTAKRSRSFPDVPTIAESGYPGYELASWNGVLAPSGTPAAIVRQLNAEINKILALPEIQGRLIDVGYEPVGGAPEDFGNLIRREISKWDPIVKAAKIKAE